MELTELLQYQNAYITSLHKERTGILLKAKDREEYWLDKMEKQKRQINDLLQVIRKHKQTIQELKKVKNLSI